MNPLTALYNAWMSTPAAIREPIRSAVVASGLGGMPVIGTLYTTYFNDFPDGTWHGFFASLLTPRTEGAILLAIAMAYRANQGHQAATKVTESSAAVSAPLPPPPEEVAAVAIVTTTPLDPTKQPPEASP